MAGQPAVRATEPEQPVRGDRVRVPAVVAPTLLLFAGALLLGTGAAWLALAHLLSPWLTIPMHVVAMCAMFVVAHECGHHTAGRLSWVNDAIGRLALPFVSLVGAFGAARYVHLGQHRRDEPGHLTPWNLRGPVWLLPLRWLVCDFWHVWAYLKRTADRPQLELAEIMGLLVFVPAAIAAVIATGHGWEVTVIYLLPQRIALALVAWWSDWRPRRQPADAPGYHAVHRRHPHVPFHRYAQAGCLDRPIAAGTPEAQAQPAFHRLRIVRVRRLTDEATEIGFAIPAALREQYEFTPGQYIEVRAPLAGALVSRRYSLCSLPGEDQLRIAVKQVRDGLLSTYLTTMARPGETLEVRPPAGRFTASPSARGKHYVAVAAGVGIAPLMPILVHTLETSARSRVTLWYVNRRGTDTIFADELSTHVRRFEGRLRVEHFRTDAQDPDLHTTVRAASAVDSIASALSICYERYHRGGLDARRLRSALDRRLHPAKVDEWLVCAPAGVTELLRMVLAEHRVPETAVRTELFQTAPEVPLQANDEPTIEIPVRRVAG